MEQGIHRELGFKDYAQIFRRRSQLFMWIVAPILTIGVAIAFGLPAIYVSSGTILIEQQEIPEYLVRSTVTSVADERISVATQRVMTFEKLAPLVEKFGLYQDNEGTTLAGRVSELKSNTAVEILESEVMKGPVVGNNVNNVAFTVSFGNPSPILARDVASDLVNLYMTENRQARQDRAAETTEFLAREAQRLKAEIAAKEAELADFKRQYSDAMPDLSSLNMQLMDRTERDLETVEREIRALRERQSLLESELSQLSPYSVVFNEEGGAVLSSRDRLKMLQRRYVQLSAVYSPDHPDVQRVKREIESLAEQSGEAGINLSMLQSDLVARRNELAGALDKYAPDHPDVVRLNRIVSNLEAAVAENQATGGRTRSTAPAPADNPDYIQRRVQLDGTRTELRALLARRTELQRRMDDYENRLMSMPEVERQYSELSRGYDQLVEQYAEVDRNMRESEIALTLESESRGEHFTVLDSPTLAGSPSSPNRPAILLLAIVLAFAIGAGGLGIAEVADTKVRGARDVEALLEMPPLAIVPNILNDTDTRALRLRRVGAFAAIFLWVAITMFFILKPVATWTGTT